VKKVRFASVVAIFAALSNSAWAQSQNACDLNNDGVVDSSDVTLAVNMTLGLSPCTANIAGSGVCNMVVVQRVLNAVLNGTCVTAAVGNSHSVSVSWTASVSTDVVGYNVYRMAEPNGAYAKVNSALISGTAYVDATVAAGQNYAYVATAVDVNSYESVYSTDVLVTIQSP
jgi:hypothetical protein